MGKKCGAQFLWKFVFCVWASFYVIEAQSDNVADDSTKQCSTVIDQFKKFCPNKVGNMTRMPVQYVLPSLQSQNGGHSDAVIISTEFRQQIDAFNNFQRLFLEINRKYKPDGWKNFIGCSKHMRFYLCELHVPQCHGHPPQDPPRGGLLPHTGGDLGKTNILKPCRGLCDHVSDLCMAKMGRIYKEFQLSKEFNCEALPAGGTPALLCSTPPNGELEKERLLDNDRLPSTEVPVGVRKRSEGDCTPFQVKVKKDEISNSTCLQRCTANVLFTRRDKDFANVWIVIWSSVCFVSTFLTLCCFAVDRSRFVYPEKATIFMSLCFLLFSVSFLIRAFVGYEAMSCLQIGAVKNVLADGHNDIVWCTMTFALRYYFGMAAAVWWVILTFTWFLSASRKWGNEGIDRYGNFIHLFTWGLPAVKLMLIILYHAIEADELTGLCRVGSRTTQYGLYFIIIPLVLYLVVGIIFLVYGFTSIHGVRRALRKKSHNAQYVDNLRRLEKLMVKIAIFASLYIIPAVTTIGCHVYEYINKPGWWDSILKLPTRCFHPEGLVASCRKDADLPLLLVYMLELFMSIIIGITSSMCIWFNRKSLVNFRLCCGRWIGGDKPDYGIAATFDDAAGVGGGSAMQMMPPPQSSNHTHALNTYLMNQPAASGGAAKQTGNRLNSSVL